MIPALCVPLVTCGGASGLTGSLAHAAAGAVLDTITAALSSTAGWLVGHVIQLVTGAGHVDLTEPWFVGFAPADNPKVAVVVTIQRTQGGFGATVAAPIARAVLQVLLSEGQ